MPTPEEIKNVARLYAEQDIPLGDPDLSNTDRDDMVDTVADFAEQILRWLTKTHCIVRREKVKNIYHTWNNALVDQPQSQAHKSVVATLHSIFDKSTFEERSEK